MVDNCYGEFVEPIEPSDVGADMIVGSLIKNPGGGLAPIGGYICGTKTCVDRCGLPPYRSWSGSRKSAQTSVMMTIAVSGLLPGADGRLRCAQGRNLCRERLREAWFPRRAEFDGDPATTSFRQSSFGQPKKR